EFLVVKIRVDHDIASHAILNSRRVSGAGRPERVPGTCAREEGLRTLTSPRREASLFKLGRTSGFGQFSFADFTTGRSSCPRRKPRHVGGHAGASQMVLAGAESVIRLFQSLLFQLPIPPPTSCPSDLNQAPEQPRPAARHD